VTVRLVEEPFAGPLGDRLADPPAAGLRLYWLGQAGFVIETGTRRIAIDPYLSDTLAAKYANTPYSHRRLSPPPATPDDLGALDLVLCTHHHTDHMDPGTLAPLARRLPGLRFVVPAASTAIARERAGVADDRLLPLDAGENIEPFPGLNVTGLPAAHETIERDESGRCRFLGYAIAFGRTSIFHSGDCAPYPGQTEDVARASPALALLPVNGRTEALSRAGFAGNFRVEEAIALCAKAGVPAMIAHHYGMFAFNTVDPDTIDAALASAPVPALRAKANVVWTLLLD
jgi:L-ascorbate metabolism protein UlaG (beta-lactamase superfamily)